MEKTTRFSLGTGGGSEFSPREILPAAAKRVGVLALPLPALLLEDLAVPVPAFTSRSRLLLFAPHPDDESLGCSILLQRAVRARAMIRVVYVTDGDDNPWPQRVLERKWRLNDNDRRRWGRLRRTEALAALRVLGMHGSAACFLGLPDQKLSAMLMRGALCSNHC
ncbi:MAG: hypothetical protein DME39_05235 [Verrucomicrobia bacterium]|nr:MAG: hypothetical protein DME39_05235 [Verrucomicrobiota bacterium]